MHGLRDAGLRLLRYAIDRIEFALAGSHRAEVLAQHGVIDIHARGRRGDDFVQFAGMLVRGVGCAHFLAQAWDLGAQSVVLGFRDVQHVGRGKQQIVDFVHRVRNGGVRANDGAFHAARAAVGDEFRHVQAEQAFVLPRRAAGRHKQASAG